MNNYQLNMSCDIQLFSNWVFIVLPKDSFFVSTVWNGFLMAFYGTFAIRRSLTWLKPSHTVCAQLCTINTCNKMGEVFS